MKDSEQLPTEDNSIFGLKQKTMLAQKDSTVVTEAGQDQQKPHIENSTNVQKLEMPLNATENTNKTQLDTKTTSVDSRAEIENLLCLDSPATTCCSANSGCSTSSGCSSNTCCSTTAPDETPHSNKLVVENIVAPASSQPNQYWGIKFSSTGQVFFFPAANFSVRIGTKVLINLENGPLLGDVTIILDRPEEPISEGELGSGTINRLASAHDVAVHAENHILAAEASAFCKTCIRQRNLDMKLVHVEVMHDVSKIIFFFTAPSRIDFRELVKDLVSTYRTRIELRQIGVRHEAQMIGGIGNCGMVCCCHSYLRKFAPVAIKMAKEQNLFLNPAKLSGMCGRLLCCLSFEQSSYEAFNRRCPKIGKRYQTDKGNLKILRTNMLTDSISAISDKNEELEIKLEEWENSHPSRLEQPVDQGDDRDDQDASDDLILKNVAQALEDTEQKPRYQQQKPRKRKLSL